MNEVELKLRQMERILEISRELSSTISLKRLLHQIVQAAMELIGSETAAILLLDTSGDELRFVVATNLLEQLQRIPVPVDASVAGTAFSTGKPLVVQDAQKHPRYYPVVEQLTGVEARSLLAVPVRFRDRPIGALEVENKRQPRDRYDEKDVENLTVLAAQAAVAIENARLMETLQKAHDLTRALRQAGAALSSPLDYDEVLDRILEQMEYVVGYDAANIMLIEGDTAQVFRGRGYETLDSAKDLTSISFRLSDVAGFRKMQRTGQPLAIPNVEEDDTWIYSHPKHAWIKSYAGIPIRLRGRVIGFLNLNSTTPGFYNQSDAERLQTFADHAAIVIENARLYRQAQQELGERVQAERELRKHRDQLEEAVQERTAELQQIIAQSEQLNWQLQREVAERARAEERLREYAIELEARNRELDGFAHTVAHDLQNPISLIIGFAEVLETNTRKRWRSGRWICSKLWRKSPIGWPTRSPSGRRK